MLGYSVLLPFSGGGVTDHGALTGLSDDDHSIYLLASGGRGLTADWNAGSFDIRLAQLGLEDTNATHYLMLVCGSDLSEERSLSFVTGDSDRTVTLSGNPTLGDWFNQGVKSTNSPTLAGLTLTGFSGVLKATAGVVSDGATYTDVGAASSGHTHDYSAVYLGISAKAADSDLLDGHDGSYYGTRAFSMTSDGVLTVGTDKAPTIIVPFALTIVKAKVVVKTAPTGASILVDVNKNGTTIFTTQGNRPTIAAGNTTDDSGTPDVTSLAEGDLITFDVDQVGSSVPGSDLTVELICTVS